MPYILTLQKVGNVPQGVILPTAQLANDAAIAIVRGLGCIAGDTTPSESDLTAFLLTKSITRVSWTDWTRTYSVTVERAPS